MAHASLRWRRGLEDRIRIRHFHAGNVLEQMIA
jgi:hypothetical protein